MEHELFILEKPYSQLNFPHEGGVTAYFSSNMTQEDLALVKEFLADAKLNPLNTRAFKQESTKFVITVGSVEEKKEEFTFKDCVFTVHWGEFSPYLREVTYYLQKAKDYAANDLQKEMLDHYIRHFQSGSVEEHKDA